MAVISNQNCSRTKLGSGREGLAVIVRQQARAINTSHTYKMKSDSYMLTSKQPLRKSQGINSSTCAPRQPAMLLEEGGSVKRRQPRHTRKAQGLCRQSPVSHTGILAPSQHGNLPNGSRNDDDQSTFMSSNKHFITTVAIVYLLSCV